MLKHKTDTASELGFTIVELIIAILLCAIVLTTINVILINMVHIGKSDRDLVLANAYVDSKVEALRSQGFKSLTIGTTDLSSELPTGLTPPYSGTLTISSLNSSTDQIDISVTYNDQGASRSYAYTTYIGELGVGQY